MNPDILDAGTNNQIEIGPSLRGKSLKIDIKGDHNHVVLGAGIIAAGTTIHVRGNGNVITIGDGATLPRDFLKRPVWSVMGHANSLLVGENTSFGPKIGFQGDAGTVDVGAETTSFGGSLNIREGNTISIGRDCQFASEWWIADSDMHPIFDGDSGERINPGADIVIGEHVWLAQKVVVLKGNRIGSGAVIGAGAIVCSDIPAQAMAAGVPARVIRDNVRWERKLPGHDRSISASVKANVDLRALEQRKR